MKYFYFIFFFFSFISFSSLSTLAQEGSYFNLNMDNGLPSNHVYGAITDRHGYLWIATQKGIARYNGYDLKIFNMSEGLPYEDIWQLLEDRKGRIWLASVSSEFGYLYNNVNYKAKSENGGNVIHPREIRVFEDGIIFHTDLEKDGVPIYKEKGDTFLTQLISGSSLKNNDKQICFFITDSVNRKILICENAIYEIVENKNIITAVKLCSVSNSVLKELENKDNILYIIDNQLIIYSKKEANYFFTLNFSAGGMLEKINLINYGIKEKIKYIDKPTERGDIFVITENYNVHFFEAGNKINLIKIIPLLVKGGKISGYNFDVFWNYFITTKKDGLFINYKKNNYFLKSKIDLKNFTYLGCIPDKQCFWWNNSTNVLKKVTASKKVQNIYFNSVGDLYGLNIYNRDSLLLFGDRSYWINTKTNKICDAGDKFLSTYGAVTKRRNLYTASYRGTSLIDVINNEDKLISDVKIKKVAYDFYREKLWLYDHNKLIIYDINKNTQNIFLNNELSAFGVKVITNVTIDSTYGNIIFKGQDNIVLYNFMKNKFTPLLRNFNFSESNINIYDNKLIITGRFGILFSKVLGKDSLSKPLFYANIKDENYSYVYDCQLSWNKLLLNTDKGTYMISIPSDSEIIHAKTDSSIYNYRFILNYNDNIFNFKSYDTLFLNQKDYQLQFDVINPSGNGTLKFTYELPNDSQWHNLNANEFTFPRLRPDIYYKLLIAAHDNVWKSDNIILYVYIKPYWWQTHTGRKIVWISVIITVLLLFTIAILVTRRFVLRANNKRNIQMELELKSIYSQINPHFIFNTLNSALLLVSKNRMEEAYVHIAKFSKLLRSYIKSSRNKLITLAEEINNLKNYIDLQQTRFKNKFEYSIEIDDNLQAEQIKIPSLLLQPFVENAINHGILNKQGPGNLKIVFNLYEKQNAIICVIEDNGIGRKQSKQINESNTNKDESYGNLMIKDLVSIFNKYEQMNIEITYIDKEYPLTGTIVSIQIKKLS